MRASMEKSPRNRDDKHKLVPSPSSITTPTRTVATRSKSTHPSQTTYVYTDTSSFKQVVQMLTGCHNNPTHQPDPRSSSSHSIPPIKAVTNKKQSFRLNERRNSMKHLKIKPVFNPIHSGLPEKLSPSTLDFPSLVLSPDTPLIPDPFSRTGSSSRSPSDPGFGYCDPVLSSDAEERAIKEKGFYFYPSPSTTPRGTEPRLLSLFPVTSPRVSDSLAVPHEP
ncbi:unnamed protein product [Thlaspi arvense]|uniref:VQ domain-containing protein n=1 Tax=Thlaspi arvense TaxID=13288 RepID=A0AAU9S6Z6_THLAR|nr:unnamed protein product [Thlaspi arvense]